MSHKIFFVEFSNANSAKAFIDWLHGLEPPFRLNVNNGVTYIINNDIEKLYWLAGFEVILPLEEESI